MLVLLFLKGFFSGSEMALVNSDKIKMHYKAKQGHKGAALILKLFKTPDVLLGTTLVGTNVFTVALATIATMVMVQIFGDNGDLIALLIMSPLMLIFGEIVPKSIYQQKSNEIAPVIVFPLQAFSWLFFPVIFVFSRVARFVARLVTGGSKSDKDVFVTREQLRMIIEMADRSENLYHFDRDRIKRVTQFANTKVVEAMIPISEVRAINIKRDLSHVMEIVYKYGIHRVPVYKDNASNLIGVVTVTTWALLEYDLAQRPLSEMVKPPLYISPYETVDQVLPILAKREDRMAVVVDEFSSAIGIITMEDILKEVTGEIEVGYMFEQPLPQHEISYKSIGDSSYLMDGRFPISQLNEILGTDLPSKEFHTVGGLIMAQVAHIPQEGESVENAGYRFVVEKATERSIESVRVDPL
jgi:CBS domain containing-hemolysin-like protein